MGLLRPWKLKMIPPHGNRCLNQPLPSKRAKEPLSTENPETARNERFRGQGQMECLTAEEAEGSAPGSCGASSPDSPLSAMGRAQMIMAAG